MSWELMAIKCRSPIEDPDEITDDMQVPLGTQAQVRKAIKSAYPEVDWSDEAYGKAEDDEGGVIEFDLGGADAVKILWITVHSSDEIIRPLLPLVDSMKWVLLDTDNRRVTANSLEEMTDENG